MAKRQKMLTAAILRAVPALYSQDGLGDEAIVHAKFFNPCGDQTWYMTELDPATRRAFGLVCMRGESELGYFDLNELEAIKLQAGLYIERDIWFKPCKLSECKDPCRAQ